MVLFAETMAEIPGRSALLILTAIGSLSFTLGVLFYFGIAQVFLGVVGRFLRNLVRRGFESWRRWLSWANAGVFTTLAILLIVVGVRAIDDFPYLSVLLGAVTLYMGIVACLAYVHLDMERDEVERGYKALHNPLKGQDPARDLAAYGSHVGLFVLIGAAISAVGGFALLNLGVYESFGRNWYAFDAGSALFSDFLVYSIINLYRVVDLLDLANHHRLVKLSHVQPTYWPATMLLNGFKTFFTFVLLQQIIAAIRKGNLLYGTIADFFNPHQVIHDRARDGLAGFGVGAIGPLFSFVRRGGPLTKEHRDDLVDQLAGMGPSAIPPLAKRIRDPNEQVRALSVEALGRLHALQVVADLGDLGNDESALVRTSRVVALGEFLKLGVREIRKRQSLFLAWQRSPWRLLGWRARLKRLRDRDPVLRIEEQLRQALKDPLPEIRAQAASQVARLSGESRDVVNDLTLLLEDADEAVRTQAAVTLGKMGPLNAATIAALARCLADSSPTVRVAAVEAVGASEKGQTSSVPELVALLNDHNETVREKVAQVLGAADVLQGPAAERLIQELKSPDALVRARTAEAVGNIGPAAKMLAPALVEAAHDTNDRVRAKAIKALGKIGEEAAVAALSKLVVALRDPDPWVSSLAAEALGEMGDAADGAVPELIRSLGHQNLQVRMQAVEALGKLGPAAQAAIPQTELLCHDSDAAIRALAIETLGLLGVRPRTQVHLREALADPIPAVRRAALTALKRASHFPPESLDAITRAVGDENEDVRIHACEVLAEKLGADPLVVHVLSETIVNPGRPETRVAAANLLGQLGAEAQSAVPVLLQAMQGADATVREAALRAIVFLQGPDASAAFLAGLNDDDPAIRILASAGWRKADIVLEEAIPLLIRALHDPEARVRANVAYALGRIEFLPNDAIDPLIECARDPHDDVRIHAAVALRTAPSSSALLVTFNQLLHDPHPRIRLIAAQRVTKDFPFQDDAQAVIRESLANTKPTLRNAALDILRSLGAHAAGFSADLRSMLEDPEAKDHHEQARTILAAMNAPREEPAVAVAVAASIAE